MQTTEFYNDQVLYGMACRETFMTPVEDKEGEQEVETSENTEES